MYFKDVIGQDYLKKQLIHSIQSDRFGHALVFNGDLGRGGFPLAVAFYRYLSCKNRGEEDACGSCSSCVKLDHWNHPDLHFVYPIAKLTSPKKDVSAHYAEEWQALLKEGPYFSEEDWQRASGQEKKTLGIFITEASEIVHKFSMKPYESDRQCIIILLPEKMNTATANKILKILEEPPSHSSFIFVSEDQNALLPTIISRLQSVNIPPIEVENIKNRLVDLYHLSEEKAGEIARLAEGNFNRANHLLKEGGGDMIDEQFQLWMRICYKIDYQEIYKWVESVHGWSREQQVYFAEHALKTFRNCLMLNYASEDLVMESEKGKGFLFKFSPFIHSENILQLIDEMEQLIVCVQRNVYSKMAFMDCSLKVCKLLRVKNNHA